MIEETAQFSAGAGKGAPAGTARVGGTVGGKGRLEEREDDDFVDEPECKAARR